ncbi:MAG: hypothetical protein WC872_00385 [Candidatus Absconditabacterales bacterium]
MAIKKNFAKRNSVGKVEERVKKFATSIEKEANVVKAESKEFGSKIEYRWETSTTEEKIYTIIGIILLILGLYVLKEMIGGLILIILGLLFVTGYFVKKRK